MDRLTGSPQTPLCRDPVVGVMPVLNTVLSFSFLGDDVLFSSPFLDLPHLFVSRIIYFP